MFADIKTKEYKTRPKQRGEDVAMYAALLKNRQRPIVGGADANASSLGAMRYDAKLKPFRGSIHTHRATWWKSSSRAAREIVALATVFLLTFYVSYSRTTTTTTTTTYTPSQHGLEMRKYYAEQWKEVQISHARGSTSTCGIFFFRQTQVVGRPHDFLHRRSDAARDDVQFWF